MYMNMQQTSRAVVNSTTSELRTMGRDALRGKWKEATIVVAICVGIILIPTIFMNHLFGSPLDFSAITDLQTRELLMSYYGDMKVSYMSYLYIIIIAGPVSLGMTFYFIKVFRGGETRVWDALSGFERFGKALGLMLFMTLFIVLWSMIPIAGVILAIIASIRYSMSYMIMIDHPELSIPECVRRSKHIMMGNKGKYFIMCLSFIGWMFLAAFVQGMISGIASVAMGYGIVLELISFVAGIGLYAVQAYLMATEIAFYEIASGHIQEQYLNPGFNEPQNFQ